MSGYDNHVKGLEVSRRGFLQGLGAVGFSLLTSEGWSGTYAKAIAESVGRRSKSVNFLPVLDDGAWGWQFTDGARIVEQARRTSTKAIGISTESGDYARFFFLAPERGKRYTLSAWVRTEGIQSTEENAGAYIAASQFEFQARPTEFTVDGKQLAEKRYGNLSGSVGWKRISQTFLCQETTTWFEVIVGVYRAKGKAWFSDITFVGGDQAADSDSTVDLWQAMQWVHEDQLAMSKRTRPVAAILQDDLPVRGAASNPKQVGTVLSKHYAIQYLTAEQLADPGVLTREHYDLLVLTYGESFPLKAQNVVQNFLAAGGDLLSTGGYAFQSPVVQQDGRWVFYEDVVRQQSTSNLLPELDTKSWSGLQEQFLKRTSATIPGVGACPAGQVSIPSTQWDQEARWICSLPLSGHGQQFHVEAWIRTEDVLPAPAGDAFIAFEQLDEHGGFAYAAPRELERLSGTTGWRKVERLIYLLPECRTLKVSFGLKNATGTLWAAAIHVSPRMAQFRMNTSTGVPQDELKVAHEQIGMFDADARLKLVTTIAPQQSQGVIGENKGVTGTFEGYISTCTTGINQARWIPLLEGRDALGRKRGAAGALVHHMRGPYARSSWAFFGIENADLFAVESQFGEQVLDSTAVTLVTKCYLHDCETDLACYKEGETVHLRVIVSNLGRGRTNAEVQWVVLSASGEQYRTKSSFVLAAGQSVASRESWNPNVFAEEQYVVTAALFIDGRQIDQIQTGFVIWSAKTLAKGLPFRFHDNYFQVEGRSVFLQGTDDYIHAFLNVDENPQTWQQDAQGCRDACIDVYENLLGLRGPQQRPTRAWWRWLDAMLLNVQRSGGIFFPGMLVFSNTAVSDKDLDEQKAYVRTFAARYKDAAGIMYYLNGDLELHDPNVPDLQRLYNDYLRQKYGSEDALRKAWSLSPPESPIGSLAIRRGTDQWQDVRTLDDFEFRTKVVHRWLNTLYDSIREVDATHPVTAEFYQLPTSGIDLLTVLGKLELANFGYFNADEEDYYRFPQTCKLLDQRVRGKGINVGEFGVKTHPAWRDADDYISARSEAYEQAYFLAIAHYGFALGASKIQNWCWKYPSDLPFEWGINYPNELIAREVRAFYRNTGLFFRKLAPRYRSSKVLFLIPGENRKGGQGRRVLEGITNAIRLLIDQCIDFNTLPDEFIDEIPDGIEVIFYPLPYCPSDAIIDALKQFVSRGGKLYISGDLSYDGLRQRTRTARLEELCGVSFVAERYPNIQFAKECPLSVVSKVGNWPKYSAFPGIVTRLHGAQTLLEGSGGVPIVTEYQYGQGKVVFSADPVELHGDARSQPFAPKFYETVCGLLGLRAEVAVEPASAPVHSFRVPQQGGDEVVILVNHHRTDAVPKLQVQSSAGAVELGLNARLSGAIVARPDGIHAIESSLDVSRNNVRLIRSNLHQMTIAYDDKPIEHSSRLLVLPMGTGQIQIATRQAWTAPVVLVGEMENGGWKQYECFSPALSDGYITMNITEVRSLSMMLVCELDAQENAIAGLTTWVYEPWKL